LPGLDINIKVGPWYEIKQKLIDKKNDVLPFVSYSKERDKLVDFKINYPARMKQTVSRLR